ncbi:hypothetical protein [Bifidobacterium pseudolongum]|uniref:Preprotein translocase subunit SecB n=2 Tax=Bifidobacterium pseudolongum TaxID=1694 RepID=A0A0A7IE43_9BIFI|nr:hypothetical protein [Bifidobacterium pseudolongum]AIZ17074.1 hypothetical protein AH67_05375 [Bifidobacterium pseudolongum PV8-2]RGW09879.1 hypothetical protein DWV92_04575 [Bifidobacterium pseudolongum]RYQ70733.1 hypothetical protein PG2023B_1024 [Bifidobacterium pseudolongum subsp. globosum]
MTIEELLNHTRLTNLRMQYEREGMLPFIGSIVPEAEDMELDQAQWKVAAGITDEELNFISGIRLRSDNAFYEVHYSIDYALEGCPAAEVGDELICEFFSRVAFFAVYPYFRASISQQAARIEEPAPLLPIVKAGDVSFNSMNIVRADTGHDSEQSEE